MKRYKNELYGYALIFTLILTPISICKVSAPTAIHFISNFQYGTIQEAINAATPGETIIIPAGIYQETIIVNKTLTILGKDKLHTIIQKNDATDIVKIVANNVYFSNFTVRNGIHGITVTSSNNTITENVAFNNSIGIHLNKTSHNIVSNNLINKTNTHPGSGIFLNGSTNNLLSNNRILESGEGIYLRGSSNNTVIRNWLTNNSKTGICLMKAEKPTDYNIIRDNIIEEGACYGIDFWSVKYNVIINNTLKYNGNSFMVSYSNNNTIYHNTIINKPTQIPVYSIYSQNNWDNGFEGNYWSNYKWTEFDEFGIGTKPYNTSRNPIDQDGFPLRSPYMVGDANHDSIVNIKDVNIVAIAWNTTQGTPKYNPHADFNMDNTIDVADIETLHKNWQKTIKP